MSNAKIKLSLSEEKEFRDWIFNNHYLHYRFGFLAFLIVHSLFIFLDYQIAPKLLIEFILVRVIIGPFFLIMTIIITYFKNFKKYYLFFNTLSSTILPISLIYLLTILLKNGIDPPQVYFAGIILQMIVAGLVIYKWKVTAFANLTILFVYYLFFLSPQISFFKYSTFSSSTIFMITTAIISTILTFFYQTINTKNFKIEKKLINEEIKLNEINKIIELQKIELAENIKLKDKFFSIIAHDLRSPFSGLIGLSDIMTKEIETFTKEEIRNFSEVINKSANNTFNLLNELLDWSRIQIGKMPFQPEIYNVKGFIEDTVSINWQKAKSKNIKIDIKLDTDLMCYCDNSMILTVLRNLISNAIKFTNVGGEIIISSLIVHDECIISVKDDGVGISKKNLDKLFSIDSKLTTSGTANEIGTGLGLILCKEFIEKHGGRIWVESEEGIGSNFQFTLPRNEINLI